MTVLLKHLQTQIHAQQSQVIFAEPADVGFGCISRRRAFTIFLRRDAGSWVQEPQEVYNRLSAKLKQKQLPLSELLWADQAQIESEVHQLTKAKKSTRTASCLLTSFEQKNKEVYQQVLADKGELPQNVVYVPSQNPKWVFKAARAGRLPCFTATDKMLYVDALNRPITSSEKFSGHGYPAREDLAKALGVPAPCQQCSHCHIYTLVGPMSWCVGVPQETIPSRMCVCGAKVFDASLLTRPHTVVGNGQHLVCAALVLVAALASIELADDSVHSLPKLIQAGTHVPVAADGRCLFASLYLHRATDKVKQAWLTEQRNHTGFALSSKRLELEDRNWFSSAVGRF